MFTFRWRFVGCMYCPRVKQSTSASRNTVKRKFLVSGKSIMRDCQQLENTPHSQGWTRVTLQHLGGLRPAISMSSSHALHSAIPAPARPDVAQSQGEHHHSALQSLVSLQRWHALFYFTAFHCIYGPDCKIGVEKIDCITAFQLWVIVHKRKYQVGILSAGWRRNVI